MPKITDKPLHRAHLRLYREDWDELRARYGGTERGVTDAVRSIIHSYVVATREKERKVVDTLPALTVDDEYLDALMEEGTPYV